MINKADTSKYQNIRQTTSVSPALNELRISFLHRKNINTVLAKNYYTLTLWTCSNAQDLKADTLAYESLATGKAIDVMAASTLISNNGVNNKASLEDMKKNNFYYFFYHFFKNTVKQVSRSESFFLAKKEYTTEILKNTTLLGEGNYGFNLINVLSYHYLGLIDIPETKNTGTITLPKETIVAETTNSGTTNTETVSANTDHIFMQDNVKRSYSAIKYVLNLPDKKVKINSVEAITDSEYVYFRIKFYSPIESNLMLFLQEDVPGLKEQSSSKSIIGDNIVVLRFTKTEINAYKAGLALNLGNRNFVFIDRTLMREVAAKK